MTIWWWVAQHTATIAVLVALVALICRFVPNRPALQHALWLVVLVKFLMPPWILWPFSANDLSQPLTARWAMQSPDTASPESEPAQPFVFPSAISDSSGPDREAPRLPPPHSESTHATPLQRPQSPFAFESPVSADKSTSLDSQISTSGLASLLGLSRLLLGLWFIGSAVVLLRQGRRIAIYGRLVRRATVAPEYLTAEVAQLARALRVRSVAVVVSPEISSPVVWCLGQRIVIWPAALADKTNLGRWQGVIAHELAHIRRRDHWIAWLELATGVLWWWNPLFWFSRRRLREPAEIACDALAVAALPDGRRAYADAFLELSIAPRSVEPAPVLGVGSRDPKSFERRLSMILSPRLVSNISWPGLLAATLFACIAVPSWSLGQAEPPGSDREAPAVENIPENPAEVKPSEPSQKVPENAYGRERYQAPEPKNNAINVPVDGTSEMAKPNHKIARVEIEDSSIATADIVEDHIVRISGKRAGLTKLKLWNTDKQMEMFEVAVFAAKPPKLARETLAPPASTPSNKITTVNAAEPGGGEPLDLTSLGVAIIEARGEVELAHNRYDELNEMNKKGLSVSKADLKAEWIKTDTAREKLMFLTNIAQLAYDSANNDVLEWRVNLERTKKLADDHKIPVQILKETRRILQTAEAKLNVLKSFPGMSYKDPKPAEENP